MDTKGKVLRRNRMLKSQPMGTGGVREFKLGKKRRLFQITTFCPDLIGPGPTHLYLIEDNDALILVDTGMPTDMAKNMFYYWRHQRIPPEVAALSDDYSEQELLTGLKKTGHDVKDIDFIVLTHGHPDHYLLGNKLAEMSGAKVAVHVSDSDQVSNPWGMVKFWVERRSSLMAMGMPMPKQGGRSKATVHPENTDMSIRIDCPIAFDGRLYLDGFEKDEICVRHYAGHSPGGIALLLYDDKGKDAIMLCGDTLLYPITPHPDDLVAYLRTLRAMKKLDEVVLTLPAHGKALPKLPHRLDFLDRHHEGRLRLTYETCKTPHSVWDIATMKGYFDTFVHPKKFNPLAGQETFVHVELLQLVGGLRTSHLDGFVHYFENSGEKFEDVYERVQHLIADESTTALSRR